MPRGALAQLHATTPARISRPPSSWTGRGSSPSSSQAHSTPATTSVSATNEASREPEPPAGRDAGDVGHGRGHQRRAGAAGPTRRPSCPAYATRRVAACIGSSPTSPRTPRATVPTTRPPAASTIGGRPLDSSAEMMKYVAQPTIAPSAQSTPGEAEVGPGEQVEDQHQPERREPGADQVTGPGRWPWRSQSQTTTAAGRGVLDQQRRTDLHVLDRGEVAELRAGDRDHAVRRDQAGVAAQQVPAPAQRTQRRTAPRPARRGRPGPRRRRRRSSRRPSAAGQRAGQAERTAEQREHQTRRGAGRRVPTGALSWVIVVMATDTSRAV